MSRFSSSLAWSFCALAFSSAAASETLNDRILDSKYHFGDYALYVGWHDPQDWQFDEHASSALPFGVKVRWHALEWLQLEGDASYFQRGGEAAVTFTSLPPKIDAFTVALSAQWRMPSLGSVRPYLGVGPVVTSIGNDFLAFRPDLQRLGVSDGLIELYSWTRLDVGWQAQAGVDLPLGGRWFPFAEFKYQFGEATFGAEDVRAGQTRLSNLRGIFEGGEGRSLEISDLETVPDVGSAETLLEDLDKGGRPHEGRYDWSGPIVMLGLKIRF
ncbi:MAG: hypothetical protein DHS20C21_21990 [Gemmatimonadota bacterium]|nr:MAG: hypothetical protein DHS20C21_21990 [Gemmatimonadota bacterium]